MPIPVMAIALGVAAASTFLSAYQSYQAKQVSDYTSGYQFAYNRDVERFYSDYQRRTGQRIKYPYKSGAIPDYSKYHQSRYSSNTAYYGTVRYGLGATSNISRLYDPRPSYNGGYVGMYN